MKIILSEKEFKEVIRDIISEELVKSEMSDILITIPSTISWPEYQKELKAVEDGSQVMNFKVSKLPVRTAVGNKCYICYGGNIIGWMKIVGLKSNENFDCTTTGKQWSGNFIQRSGVFHKLEKPIPMKGFQGFRYFQNNLNEEKIDSNATASAVEQLNSKQWWRTAINDDAIKSRGLFLSSTYEGAEFYGKPINTPFKVNVKNPLIGDEISIMNTLGINFVDPSTIQERFDLDKQMRDVGVKKGYDSIALISRNSFNQYKKTGQLPNDIELNVF